MIHTTFNAYHLGDNLIHLHFLRKLAQRYQDHEFRHFAAEQHRAQLLPLTTDLPNLRLIEDCPADAINAWRGDMGFWYCHTQRNDFTRFHFDWFAHLAAKMGLESPIRKTEDMLFDYVALTTSKWRLTTCDFLVINSRPHSGQFRSWNAQDFETLVHALLANGQTVVTTAPTNTAALSTNDGRHGLSVTEIGAISMNARNIVGVATGPIWTTFNIWNREARRILMLDEERIHLTPNVHHVGSCAEAMEILK